MNGFSAIRRFFGTRFHRLEFRATLVNLFHLVSLSLVSLLYLATDFLVGNDLHKLWAFVCLIISAFLLIVSFAFPSRVVTHIRLSVYTILIFLNIFPTIFWIRLTGDTFYFFDMCLTINCTGSIVHIILIAFEIYLLIKCRYIATAPNSSSNQSNP